MPSSPAQRPSCAEALAWTIALGALWIIVYAGCNWITSLRASVPTLQFAWEKHIPLIPWMIIPYMSIDLFFVGAPFLCRTRSELRTLIARLAAATLVAGSFFLMLPLTLAGDRPTWGGWAGAIHDFLKAGDKPFNLFPSLHIALLLLLWPVYHRRTSGPLRIAIHIWFALILLSVLPVYQHHFIDIVGGALLALVCICVFQDTDAPTPRHIPLGLRYALAAALLIGAAVALGPWGILPAWAGWSLAAIACAYLFAGPSVLGKRNGRIRRASRFVLAPYFLGLNASRRYFFSRMNAPWSSIGDVLIVSRRPSVSEAEQLIKNGVVAVIDLTAEHNSRAPLLALPYFNPQTLDLTAPTLDTCLAAADFIDEHAPRGRVLIHCGLGYSRSALIAAAWLIRSGRTTTAETAIAHIQAARPGVRFKPADLAILHRIKPTRTSH